MNLEIFKDLIKSTKENDGIQNFIKELGKALEESFSEGKLLSNERNQIPSLEKILDGENLTIKYKDKINMEKINILRNYAKETYSKGKMYYVYSKSSENSNRYMLSSYGEKRQDENQIELEENKLPKGAGVNSILREKNGKFVLDREATEAIRNEMTEMIKALLKEQTKMLEEQRIEGNLYEFVEKGGNRVWLMDKTNYTGECIEEFDFPKGLLEKAKQGDIFQYINGEYKFYSKI